jgi:hypothetical protein
MTQAIVISIALVTGLSLYVLCSFIQKAIEEMPDQNKKR